MKTHREFPLYNDFSSKFLSLLIGAMVYLAILFGVVALFVFEETCSWKNQLTAHVTLEIPVLSEKEPNDLQERVLDLLNKTPGVLQAVVVSSKDMDVLLQDLLGANVPIDLSVFPRLIEATFVEGEIVDILSLEAHLKTLSPQIQLIDHREWRIRALKLIRVTNILAALLAFVIFISTLIATAFAVRASLLIHKHIINVLHLIGATDAYIAKQFQFYIFKRGLISSVIGAGLAICTFFGSTMFLNKIEIYSEIKYSFCAKIAIFSLLFSFFISLFMVVLTRFIVIKDVRS